MGIRKRIALEDIILPTTHGIFAIQSSLTQVCQYPLHRKPRLKTGENIHEELSLKYQHVYGL